MTIRATPILRPSVSWDMTLNLDQLGQHRDPSGPTASRSRMCRTRGSTGTCATGRRSAWSTMSLTGFFTCATSGKLLIDPRRGLPVPLERRVGQLRRRRLRPAARLHDRHWECGPVQTPPRSISPARRSQGRRHLQCPRALLTGRGLSMETWTATNAGDPGRVARWERDRRPRRRTTRHQSQLESLYYVPT